MALFELKIYGEDDEILRTYESNRLRWGKLLQAVKISEECKGKTASEQLESIYEVFQSIFPKLTRDDYEAADARDIWNTYRQVLSFVNNIDSGTAKNS